MSQITERFAETHHNAPAVMFGNRLPETEFAASDAELLALLHDASANVMALAGKLRAHAMGQFSDTSHADEAALVQQTALANGLIGRLLATPAKGA
jgi:hypothetical protein